MRCTTRSSSSFRRRQAGPPASSRYDYTGFPISGSLQITTGLTSIPIDAKTTLVAEPGKQLVIRRCSERLQPVRGQQRHLQPALHRPHSFADQGDLRGEGSGRRNDVLPAARALRDRLRERSVGVARRLVARPARDAARRHDALRSQGLRLRRRLRRPRRPRPTTRAFGGCTREFENLAGASTSRTRATRSSPRGSPTTRRATLVAVDDRDTDRSEYLHGQALRRRETAVQCAPLCRQAVVRHRRSEPAR